jgi:hypothetical protein
MTKGQSYKGPNTFRTHFYEKVTEVANKVSFREFPHFGVDDSFPKFTVDTQRTDDPKAPEQPGVRVKKAGELLAKFVDPGKLMDRKGGQPRRPLVIFSFDEAHVLTDSPPMQNRATNWNLFSELRRILRDTSDYPIFSLFLSTAGRFNLFSPEIRSDPSMRIKESQLSTLDPITEITFDDLAYDAPENKILLERVVKMDWICHLGRPLYALFGYPIGEQLTSHLEQVCVHLRRGKERDKSPGLREGEVAGWPV